MPSIYFATPKNTTPLIGEKLKYVVVKDGAVKILNNKKYGADSSRNFTFVTVKSYADALKNHIKANIENLNIDYPNKFLELLEDEFDIQEQQEFNHDKLQDQENNLLAPTSKSALDEEHKQLIEAILSSQPSPPMLQRSNSVKDGSVPEDTFLRKITSFHDLPNDNSPKISRSSTSSDLSSSHDSIYSRDSLENSERTQLIDGAQKIRFFFAGKENVYVSNIKKHALNIQNGYFNGGAKSKILLEIAQQAEQIKLNINDKGNESLIDQIDILKEKISDNLATLSRYRGFSPFKCFATLWGGGRVKSIEYVEELRDQLNSLTNEISSVRSTV